MRILIDTNLLVRSCDPRDVDHRVAVDALDHLDQEGHQLRLVPQNLYELWVVGTRPTNVNGLGFTPWEMHRRIAEFAALFPLLRDERTILHHWQQLVLQHEVTGKQAHDARIVAAMHRHGINHILTFDRGHFKRFTSITVLTPQQVLA